TGGAGDDHLNGNGGADNLNGGTGDDTFVYNLSAGGRNIVDGGEGGETAGDTMIVTGTAATETFNINPIAGGSFLGINIEPGVGAGSTVPANGTNDEVRTKDVEEIIINTNGGGDSVIISGDLAGTGVATSTVHVA